MSCQAQQSSPLWEVGSGDEAAFLYAGAEVFPVVGTLGMQWQNFIVIEHVQDSIIVSFLFFCFVWWNLKPLPLLRSVTPTFDR